MVLFMTSLGYLAAVQGNIAGFATSLVIGMQHSRPIGCYVVNLTDHHQVADVIFTLVHAQDGSIE